MGEGWWGRRGDEEGKGGEGALRVGDANAFLDRGDGERAEATRLNPLSPAVQPADKTL